MNSAGTAGLLASGEDRLLSHFRRCTDRGVLPGWAIRLARGGELCVDATYGVAQDGGCEPVSETTLFRILSLTKVVTSTVALMLCERGELGLDEPVHQFIPSFAKSRVASDNSRPERTDCLREPITIWHLLTHTSGLTYGFHHANEVDARYRASGFEWTVAPGIDLPEACEIWASLPLLFQPGTCWNYSVSTDVLAHVLEIVRGQRLDKLFKELIFDPLGMQDTMFVVAPDRTSDLASLYTRTDDGLMSAATSPLTEFGTAYPTLAGGGGLVSTIKDFHVFVSALFEERPASAPRLLNRRTVRFMSQNHLLQGRDIQSFGRPLYPAGTMEGTGFGLGLFVDDSPVRNRTYSSVGTVGFGGAASTLFWRDPHEDLTALFFTQLTPATSYPIRSRLKQLVYASLP